MGEHVYPVRKDTREQASFEELQRDQQRHWKDCGKVRDERYQVVRQMLDRSWRCPQCGRQNERGGVCTTCREARLIEVE